MKEIRHYDVILGPIITEKSTMASEHNQVMFAVPVLATKSSIKRAVEELFSVKVKAVNTLRTAGKTKRFRGIKGRQRQKKKAVITLEDGYSIDVTTGL